MEAHRALVRQGAEESFVLLQNQPISNGVPILPLAPGIRKIALIGPLASSSQAVIGGDLEENPVAGTDSLLTALTTRAKMAGATVTYAKGTDVISVSDEGFAAAVSAAKEADVAVLALGETGDMSGEAGSRAHLGLPGNQKALLDAIAATGRPVILADFLRSASGINERSSAYDRHSGRLVSRNGRRLGNRCCFVWRCCP